jgi:hypothetical protein
MRITFTVLWAVAVAITGASSGHAAPKCVAEKTAYDRAVVDYNRAEQHYMRLQFQVDAKSEQGEYRRAILEGNVEVARGNLRAAQQGGFGQGIGCLFRPRATCIAPTIAQVSQHIARAQAQVRAQEGRLYSFERSFRQQMTRLSQRVSDQESVVGAKKVNLTTKEAAYQACMAK